MLLNLGWSCLKSGHPLEAERDFKQFLSEGKEITDKQRTDANDGATQARAKLGRIEVVAIPGTDVTVDGEHLGSAPLADAVLVEAGAHTVKFRSADGAADTQSVTVLGGEKTIARFKTVAQAAPPPPTPAPPPPSPAPTEPVAPAMAPASPAKAPTPADGAHATAHPAAAPRETTTSEGGGALAPPKNLLPVFLLGGAAVLGYAGAGRFVLITGQVQSQAVQISGRLNTFPGASCPTSTAQANLQPSCDALATNNDQINEDATVGNVALGVGVAATVGVIVYWLLADKGSNDHAAATHWLTPTVGPNTGGLSMSGVF